MPDSNENKLIVKLVKCSRCGNPFMIKKGGKESEELICENCIKLEQRKKQLVNSVIGSQKKIEISIEKIKNELKLAKSQYRKDLYKEKIKKRSETLTKSVELLQKIRDTDDEKYIDDYKKLFEKLKQDSSD
ncbi:MAG: hypothetical protein ACXACC_04820 [Promethearchaeota archaeon]|jgi:ssDNA-binding Zn-finger/Zn-ribbon topoisomerase 1